MQRLLSKAEAAQRVGLHPEHLMRLVRQGTFPAPIKTGDKPNCRVRFIEADIDSWLADLMAARSVVANRGAA